MGMFDYVYCPMQCPECGKQTSEFQSKDGPCTLSNLEAKDVSEFYGNCQRCGKWLRFEVVPPTEIQIRRIA